MRKLFLITALAVTVISAPYGALAQEEDMGYSYGTVVSVNEPKREIVLTEYDYETEEEFSVIYSVDPNVKLENVSVLKDIKPNDQVDVEYVIKEDGKKIIKNITVYGQESME